MSQKKKKDFLWRINKRLINPFFFFNRFDRGVIGSDNLYVTRDQKGKSVKC